MKTCIALLSVLITGIGFSQRADSLKTKNTRFIVKMTHGMTGRVNFDYTNAEWEKMTPGFEIPDSLKPMDHQLNFNDNIRSISNGSYYMFSFSFINNKKMNQADRKFLATTTIHLGYGPEIAARKDWYHENKQVIDTLSSSQTGQEFYVMGNRNQSISKIYHSQTLVFGAGEHIATNPNRIFQFETGLDVLCLLSLSSRIKASYIDTYIVEGLPQDPNGGYYPAYPYPATEDIRTETFSSKVTAGLIMRVPLEISFKLSRTSPVASRMRIGAELNPGLTTVFTGGLITSNFNVSGGMNFRFAF
ncbi:hypothetical protein [Fluviicola sp.]|uniref:hypothetical protein n=1 Tax=Fluviicola sp. TaxID=1917219 RepID=UPI0031D3170F